MERYIDFEHEYLCLPVQIYNECGQKNPEYRLEIFLGDENKKLFEFMVPVGELTSDHSYPVDYYAQIRVGKLTSGLPTHKPLRLLFKGEKLNHYFSQIKCTDDPTEFLKEFVRPGIHFTANTGWINDPNGLVYQDGIYHLYFQYNPFNISWQNMSWGHAVSKDLLHWTQLDTVMTPDENGTVFSGSAILNKRESLDLPKDAILYFYTAAGDGLEWSNHKSFTQRVAYSVDGGHTLHKLSNPVVENISFDNRDPKVYWHEETNSYYMVLWIVDCEFGILTSKDLKEWNLTDRFTLEDAWECPDLLCLLDENKNAHWIFTCADGYYYFGDFDGAHFRSDGIKHKLYFNKNSYAAQTYFGINDRTVFIPWLRFPNDGRLFTGAMGLPEELTLVRDKDGNIVIQQRPVREFWNHLIEIDFENIDMLAHKDLIFASINLKTNFSDLVEIMVDENRIILSKDRKKIQFENESFDVDQTIHNMEILIDDNILEIWINDGILTGAFQLNNNLKSDRDFKIKGAQYKLYQYKEN